MPVLETSSYTPPLLMSNAHILTCFPTLFRKVRSVTYTRTETDTTDGDRLFLDWSECGQTNRRLAILSHGLGGHTARCYVLGMVRALNRAGWDCLCWVQRWSSDVPQRRPVFTHNGSVEDLHAVVTHAADTGKYDHIALIGFSMGANINLNYCGREPDRIPEQVCANIAHSAPVELLGTANRMLEPSNCIYLKRFLRKLHHMVELGHQHFPDVIHVEGLKEITDFQAFDERYTAPLHGFTNAEDYWRKCSSRQFLSEIKIPTLIINAADDPFMTPACYPREEADKNPNVFLEIPESGGHNGFVSFTDSGDYWSEIRTVEFLNEVLK